MTEQQAVRRFLSNVQRIDPAFHRALLAQLEQQGLGWLEIVANIAQVAASLAQGYSQYRAGSAQRRLIEEQIRQLRSATAANVYSGNYNLPPAAAPPPVTPPTNNPPPATTDGPILPQLEWLREPKVLIPVGLLLFALLRK